MAGALILALSICSVVTVTANTVTANVVDGEQSYTFHMDTIDLDQILDHAVSLGLEPLGPLDVAERVENTTTVNVRRGVSLTVTEGGQVQQPGGLCGRHRGKSPGGQQHPLKGGGRGDPQPETLLEEDNRHPDPPGLPGLRHRRRQDPEALPGGGHPWAQALEKAGVTLGEKDSVNYEADQPVFDTDEHPGLPGDEDHRHRPMARPRSTTWPPAPWRPP